MINFDLNNKAFMELLKTFVKESNYTKTTFNNMISAIKKKNYKNKQLQAFSLWFVKLDVKNSYFEYQQAESTAAEKYRIFVVNLALFARSCKSQQAVSLFLKDQVMSDALKQRISEFAKIAWYFKGWKESEIMETLLKVNKKDLLKAISNKSNDPITYAKSAAADKESSAPAVKDNKPTEGDSDVTESSTTAVKMEITKKEETESEYESRLIGECICDLEGARLGLLDSEELTEVSRRLFDIVNKCNEIVKNRKKQQKAA